MTVIDFVCIFVLGCFAFAFLSFKLAAVFQQCGYRVGEFFSAIFSGKKTEILRLSAYSLVFCVLLTLVQALNGKFVGNYFLPCMVVILVCGAYYFSIARIKSPKFTNRYIRILICSCLISGVVNCLLCASAHNFFKMGSFSIVALASPINKVLTP